MNKIIQALIFLSLLNSCTSTKNSANIATNQKKTINAVVRFIPDNSYFLNSYWNESGTKVCYEVFEEQLAFNLDNDFLKSPIPISFYTEKEIEKYKLTPDWIIYLKFTELDISAPKLTTTTLSQQQSSYADNRTIYVAPSFGGHTENEPYPPGTYGDHDMVSYTVNVPAVTVDQSTIQANATLGFNIQERITAKNLNLQSFKAKYLLVKEDVGYNVNESNNALIASSDSTSDSSERKLDVIMVNLYNKIYPRIKNEVYASLNNK